MNMIEWMNMNGRREQLRRPREFSFLQKCHPIV